MSIRFAGNVERMGRGGNHTLLVESQKKTVY
jgi:hypothetical protein